MSMTNQILAPELFTKGSETNYHVRLSVSSVSRAFAGCTDNINVWVVIEPSYLYVYTSDKPESDVYVIIETN